MAVPPYLYEETYRGISFYQTGKGYWFFNSVPPNGSHWCRYFTKEEIEFGGVASMRKAIDRYHANASVYTGDLRYR